MHENLRYRYRVRWGEKVAYGLSQAGMLGLLWMMLMYIHEHFPSDTIFPPLIYIVGVALWAYVANTLRCYREDLLAYKRLQKEQWARDA